jgi:hypothetical protein
MALLLAGIALFTLLMAVHLVVWRIRLPARQTRALLVIFLGLLPAGLLAVHLLNPALFGPWQCVHLALFHVAMSLTYVILYSAIEQESPSLAMVQFVDRAGTRGRSRQEFQRLINDELLVGNRLNNMVRAGWVQENGSSYRLTAKGRRLAWLFISAARLLGLEEGG